MVQATHIKSTQMLTPPVARGLPLVGAIPDLLRQQVDFLENARTTYGDIYRLNVPTTSMIMLNRPEHAQHVFKDHVKNYPKEGAIWDAVRDLLGNALAVSSGDFWLRQRRMMQPHFHRQRLSLLTDMMVSVIAQNFQKWDRLVEQTTPLKITPKFAEMNMMVIMRTLFGADMSDEEAASMGSKIDYVANFMLLQAVAKPIPTWLPVPTRAQFKQSIKDVSVFIQSVIDKRRKNLSNDLISMLIETLDDESGEQMTDQQLRDETLNIYVAFETTSLTLSWMMYHLMLNPTLIARLQQEVDSVLGQRLPTFDDLQKLTYTRQVFQETLRLCPPVYFLPRQALEDDEIDGFYIPAGQMVTVTMYTIHRHPEFWQTPDVFDPDHFSPEQSEGRHPMAWVPFGAGPRLCLGRDFAYMDGALILAMLIQRFTITAPDNFVTKPRLLMTLHPQKGIQVHLKPR